MTFAVVMALAFGMTACKGKTTSETVSDAAKSAGQAVGDAAKATGNAVGDAAKATGEYLAPSKDATVKTAQETLDGIEKKWQELQAKAAPVTEEAKADFQKATEQMGVALGEAKRKLVEAKDATTDVWQKDVKPALDSAVAKVQKLYEDTAAKFGSK